MSDNERHALSAIVWAVVPVVAMVIPVAILVGWWAKRPAPREIETIEPATPLTPERYSPGLSAPSTAELRSRRTPTRAARPIA